MNLLQNFEVEKAEETMKDKHVPAEALEGTLPMDLANKHQNPGLNIAHLSLGRCWEERLYH